MTTIRVEQASIVLEPYETDGVDGMGVKVVVQPKQTVITISQGGGGGGTYAVVSDVNNGLAPQTEDVAGQTLFDDGAGGVEWRPISQDDIQPSFDASLSGGGTLETGQSVVNPSFTASYVSGPPDSATLTDTDASPTINLSSPFTAVTSPHTFQKNTNGQSVVFTLSATKGSNNQTAQASYVWYPRVFFGIGDANVDTEVEVEALASSALASSRSRSFSVTPGATDYIYYAYPASYGAATFTVGGFEGGFDLVTATLAITNAYGITQNYRLYKSTNPNLGSTTVVVS